MNKIYKRIASIACACACLMCSIGTLFGNKNTAVASAQSFDDAYSSYLVPLPNLKGFSFVGSWQGTNLDGRLFTSTWGKMLSIAPNEFVLYDSIDSVVPLYASDYNMILTANSSLYDYNLLAYTTFYDDQYGYDNASFEFPCKVVCYHSASVGEWNVREYVPVSLVQHTFYVADTSTLQIDTYVYVARFDGSDKKQAIAFSLRIPVANSYAYAGGMWYVPANYTINYTEYSAFVMDEIVGWSYSSTTDTILNGYQAGYDLGYLNGNLQGENIGYNKGYAEGVDDANNYTFKSLITSVIDVPINAFRSLFNFDLLGFNMANFMLSILTLGAVLAVVRLIL